MFVKPEPENSHPRREGFRRLLGFSFGAYLGLVYGLVSQLINPLIFPGISFYQPPFGLQGNILASFLVGSLTGLTTCWAQSTIRGVFVGSAAAAAFFQLSTLFTGQTGSDVLAGKLISMFFLYLPTAAMLSPFISIFRFGINWQADAGLFQRGNLRGYLILVVLMLAAAGVGSTVRYPTAARQPLHQMDLLIKSSQGLPTTANLPPEIQPPDVEGFLRRGQGTYHLLWDNQNLNRYAIPYPAGSEGQNAVVVAHFDNGWILACLFSPAEAAPECRDYSSLSPFIPYREP